MGRVYPEYGAQDANDYINESQIRGCIDTVTSECTGGLQKINEGINQIVTTEGDGFKIGDESLLSIMQNFADTLNDPTISSKITSTLDEIFNAAMARRDELQLKFNAEAKEAYLAAQAEAKKNKESIET